ncbi:MAG: zf-HC2 domain-containing protein [Terracidiphilus sp.]|jgi:hypothetical protein
MNPTSQLDLHPGAESLNAFAEHALPERERGQILAHLAVCSRCRQVIFLAQEAASGLETGAAAAVPDARSTVPAGSWLRGWRRAWVPAAALAAMVALAVLVHYRHAEQGPELARATPQNAPQNVGSISQASSTERVSAGNTPAPASPAAAKHFASKAQSAPLRANSEALPAEVVPYSAPSMEASANALSGVEREGSALPAGASGQGIATAQYMPEQAAAARQPQHVVNLYSSNGTASGTAQTKIDSMAERAQTSRTAEARYSGSGGASMPRYKKDVSPHISYDVSAPMYVGQIMAATEAKAAPLPSGLTAISTVTAKNQTLAIDQAGALFLSEDSGSHWEAVARQWAGRAMEVRLQQHETGNTAAAAPAGGATVAPPLPATVFEIVNDQNLVWASMDGKTWKAR